MPTSRWNNDEDEEGDWTGEDWSDDADDDELDEEEAARCPECGADIPGFTDKCPKCGYWLTDADRGALRPSTNLSAWVSAVAIFLLIAFFLLFLILTIF